MTYLFCFLSLSLVVGGTSVAAGEITDSTPIALGLFLAGISGVAWATSWFVNWKRDIEEEVRDVREKAGLPPKRRDRK